MREADIGGAHRLESRDPAARLQPGLRLQRAQPPQPLVGERVEQRLLVGEMAIERRRADPDIARERAQAQRSEEHTSELQSLMRHSYAVFCLKKKKKKEKRQV